MFLPYLLISINPLFQILTYPNQTLIHRKKCLAQHPRHPTVPAPRVILSGGRSPKSNPEGDRRSGSPNAERTNPVLNLRTGKTPGQHTPYPLFKSLLKGVRGKLFSRKVFPVLPQNFDNTLTGEVCCVIMYSCFERAEKRRNFYMIFRI